MANTTTIKKNKQIKKILYHIVIMSHTIPYGHRKKVVSGKYKWSEVNV